MSVQILSRNTNDVWARHRHPVNAGIITVDCREDFTVAARDPSCFYAILKVDKASIDVDRAAYREAWDGWKDKSMQSCFQFARGDFFVSNKNGQAICSYAHIGSQLKTQAQMVLDIRRQARLIHIDVLPNFRSDGFNHDTHDHSVIARVFFAQGTFIPLVNPEDFPDGIADYSKLSADNFMQVDEGDFLYIAPTRPHWPEFKTVENREADRLTISTLPLVPVC